MHFDFFVVKITCDTKMASVVCKYPAEEVKMVYLFMDNFRGFSQTFVPFRSANFLVGENSTGKSSALSLFAFFSSMKFWMSLDFSEGEFVELGGFNDIVSVAGEKRDRFSVGALIFDSANVTNSWFVLISFRKRNGIPIPARYVQLKNGELLELHFKSNLLLFNFQAAPQGFKNEEEFLKYFENIYNNIPSVSKMKKMKVSSLETVPIPALIGLIHSEEKKSTNYDWIPQFPLMTKFAWLAPIRTKSRRTYDSISVKYGPEGEHTPFTIRDTLASKERAKEFVKQLTSFGENSGLFSVIRAHSFGNNSEAPFELLIDLKGSILNIKNVGYGISQVLPIVVEILTRPQNSWIAIQQPEVHLHPRAQAALGEFLYYALKAKNHNFLIETHSDYIIDRFRLKAKQNKDETAAQVLYFERMNGNNILHPLAINEKGQYPVNQPKSFREFFIREETDLLEL